MKIEPKSIKVKDIFDGYADNGDNGVFAYDGRLAIRPAYQREFVYSSEQAESVIHTILKGFPLNVMYWVKVGDDQYEVLDGQQRTLSVMQYLEKSTSIPMLTKAADASSILNKDGLGIFNQTCEASNLYEMLLCRKTGQPFVHEFQKPPRIIL